MEQEQETRTAEENTDGRVENAQAEERQNVRRRAREEIGQFAALFPGVGPGQVPEEVWKEVRAGQSLALAYALYRIKALESVLAEAERRSRSAQLSAGSVSSAGSTTLGGTVASFWDAYEL